MGIVKKTLATACIIWALSTGIKNCSVGQPQAPKPEDFSPKTIEHVILPELGEVTVYQGSDGLSDMVRQNYLNSTQMKAAWVSENSPELKKSYNAYTLTPQAQKYLKELQDISSKLAYELTRTQYETGVRK